MFTKPALIELQYFPPIQFFSKCLAHPKIIFEQQENYRKGSYRNRTHIASANGLLRLSIPLVKGKNQRQSIKAVKISYAENWQHQHWSAICSAYGNAPFFDYYADEIEPFFKTKYDFLFDFNLAIFNQLLLILQIATPIQFSSSFLHETGDNLIDLRNVVHPKKDKPDKNFQIVKYAQVFQEKEGFLPNLSILDLLFCQGPAACILLEQSILIKKTKI